MKYHASLVILEQDGKILLLRRFNTGFADGQYTLPSGKVDQGETFSQAAQKEALEEVGAEISLADLQSAHILHRKKQDEYWVDHFFRCHSWSGEIRNLEPHKCDHLEWFELDKLPENIIPFVGHALEQIFAKKKHYSEFGW